MASHEQIIVGDGIEIAVKDCVLSLHVADSRRKLSAATEQNLTAVILDSRIESVAILAQIKSDHGLCPGISCLSQELRYRAAQIESDHGLCPGISCLSQE